MSMACPIIGSNTGGIPELLDHKYVFPKGKIKALMSILSNIDNSQLSEQAELNFENSKKFEKSYLDVKRKNFYNEFLYDYNLR